MFGDLLALIAERLGEHAPGVLARIGGPRDVAPRPPEARRSPEARRRSKLERAALLARARAPVPPGLRDVHATWIEAALAELPPRARTAVAAPTSDPVDVWLARWATASLPPMTDLKIGGPDALAWLVGVGADQLAVALGAAADAAIARVGEPLRRAIARVGKPPRVGQLGSQRAAIARSRDLALDDERSESAGGGSPAARGVIDPAGFAGRAGGGAPRGIDELALVRLGARALGPHLAANRLARLQLTRSLPRPIGIVVERELDGAAGTSLADAPTWAALVAG